MSDADVHPFDSLKRTWFTAYKGLFSSTSERSRLLRKQRVAKFN